MKKSTKNALWLGGIVLGAAAIAGVVFYASKASAGQLTMGNTIAVGSGTSSATVSANQAITVNAPTGTSFVTIVVDGVPQTFTPGASSFQTTLTAGAHTITGTTGSASTTSVGATSFTVNVTAQ